MKRKGFFLSALVIMATMLGVSIVACDSEENNSDDNTSNAKANMAGTWKGTVGGGSYSEEYTFVFKSDGTGTYIVNYGSDYSGDGIDSGTFTYVMFSGNGGVMILEYEDEEEGETYSTIYSFAVENKKLYLMEGEDFVVLSNDKKGDNTSKAMVGTWKGTAGSGRYSEEYTFVFKSDGTGTYIMNYESDYSGDGTDSGTFTYVASSSNSGILMIEGEDEGDPYSIMYGFAIENNKLYLMEGEDEFVLSNDKKSDIPSKAMVGTWKGTEGSEEYSKEYTFVFKSDGTGTYIMNYESDYSGNGTDSGTFTYIASGSNSGILMIEYVDEEEGETYSDIYGFAIENNTLYMMEGADEGIVLFNEK